MKRYCTIITLALMSCLFAYVVYRTDRTIVNILLDHITSGKASPVRTWLRSHISLPEWCIYSLPEALWVFSAALVSRRLYAVIGEKRFYLSWMPLVYAVLLEFLQLAHVMPGSFDIMDLGLALLFSLYAHYGIRCPLPQQHVFGLLNYRTFFLVYVYALVFLSHVHIG